jgi:hypothetical protein
MAAGFRSGGAIVATRQKWFRWVVDGATVAGVIVAIVISVYNLQSDRVDDAKAEASAERAARRDVIANVLQMGEYDAEGGGRNQNEIVLLVSDVQELIEEFGREDLGLSPVVFRMMAEYVAYSTRRVELAEELADEVLTIADPEEDSVELVLAHRVLGDVAAQSRDPAGVTRQYDLAIEANAAYVGREPVRGADIDKFTRAFRLLSAYLGASLNDEGKPVHDEFCAQATAWQDANWEDLELVAERGRVVSQLRRLGVNAGNLDQLRALCA